jgi:hypothetical protein
MFGCRVAAWRPARISSSSLMKFRPDAKGVTNHSPGSRSAPWDKEFIERAATRRGFRMARQPRRGCPSSARSIVPRAALRWPWAMFGCRVAAYTAGRCDRTRLRIAALTRRRIAAPMRRIATPTRRRIATPTRRRIATRRLRRHRSKPRVAQRTLGALERGRWTATLTGSPKNGGGFGRPSGRLAILRLQLFRKIFFLLDSNGPD